MNPMQPHTFHILIIDDHPIVALGIKTIACQHEDTECLILHDPSQLVLPVTATDFDLCIVDLQYPGKDGFDLLPQLHSLWPESHILIYTMHDEPWIVAKLAQPSFRPYIQGAVSKQAHIKELDAAISALREGRSYYSPEFHDLYMHKHFSSSSYRDPASLSLREKEILRLLAKGMSTHEIAQQLCLSINTIQTYRKRLLLKMEAKNVAELISKWKNWF